MESETNHIPKKRGYQLNQISSWNDFLIKQLETTKKIIIDLLTTQRFSYLQI
jgi:hypothetical protein